MCRVIFRTLVFLPLLLCVAVGPSPARADYERARAAFESLDQNGKSAVVVGLIVSGDFAGLIDYGFTKRLYKSIQAFEIREGFNADGVISAVEQRRLNNITEEFFDPLGLKTVRHPLSGAELPIPMSKFDSSTDTDTGLSFERNDNSLALNLVAYPESERSFEDLYKRFSGSTEQRTVNYSVLRDRYFVASGIFKGRSFYTMMLKAPFGTTGFTLSWTAPNDEFARKLSIYLANSLSIDGAEPSIVGGDTDIFDGGAQDSSVDAEPGSSSGTGFFISSRGHLITNSHVVENCKSIRIKMPKISWISADVVTQRRDLDLALLKASVGSVSNFAKIRSSSSVRIGDDAVIFGFPLVGALSSDGSVSTGTIASLSGIGGDTTAFQISVPVQPGNSGGPLVDRSGNVIGVVVAKLDAIEVAKVTGDVPQNVNFAIKSEVLIKFLDWIGSAFDEASSGPSLSTADIAASLQQYSVLIECER